MTEIDPNCDQLADCDRQWSWMSELAVKFGRLEEPVDADSLGGADTNPLLDVEFRPCGARLAQVALGSNRVVVVCERVESCPLNRRPAETSGELDIVAD